MCFYMSSSASEASFSALCCRVSRPHLMRFKLILPQSQIQPLPCCTARINKTLSPPPHTAVTQLRPPMEGCSSASGKAHNAHLPLSSALCHLWVTYASVTFHSTVCQIRILKEAAERKQYYGTGGLSALVHTV